MQKKLDQKLLRIIDANFNRAKEGLRVCEDICRFWENRQKLTRKYKSCRHRLSDIVMELKINQVIHSRDVKRDVGKGSLNTELRRRDVEDIFYANSQRVKESIRVLEEFSKLLKPALAQKLKELRYSVYVLEREWCG